MTLDPTQGQPPLPPTSHSAADPAQNSLPMRGAASSPAANLARRSFLKALASLAASGTTGPDLGILSKSVVGQGLDIPNAHAMVGLLNKLLTLDYGIGRSFDPKVGEDIFNSLVSFIEDDILLERDVPIVNFAPARELSTMVENFVRSVNDATLKLREELLSQLHAHGHDFELLKAAIKADNTIDFGDISAVLSDRNAALLPQQVVRLAQQESREISRLLADLPSPSTLVRRAENLPVYKAPDGRLVYRQIDGTFRLERDSRWDETDRSGQATTHVMDEEVLDRIARSFSPEMYVHSIMPPSRFSLTVEKPAMTDVLYRHFVDRVHREMDQGRLPAVLQTALLDARIDHMASSTRSRGDAYLRIIESCQEALPVCTNRQLDELDLYRDPRAEMGRMSTADRLQFLDFDRLKAQTSLSFHRYRSDENGKWKGPIARQRARVIVHDLLAQAVVELTSERKLFFLNHPVVNLAHFQAIARDYRDSRQFAKTFLDVYARLFILGLDLTDYFTMMKRD